MKGLVVLHKTAKQPLLWEARRRGRSSREGGTMLILVPSSNQPSLHHHADYFILNKSKERKHVYTQQRLLASCGELVVGFAG